MDIENNINPVIDYLKQRIDPGVIYLFGSAAGGCFKQESDIDLAIITDKKISPLEIYNISGDLSLIARRDIHLVDFREITDVLRMEILKKGRVIFCKDENFRIQNEMKALSSYIKLNEEREIVIKSRYGEDVWMLL